MATSSITANFHCDDAKAANALVRLLARPVEIVSRKPETAQALGFASAEAEQAFCAKTIEAARKASTAPNFTTSTAPAASSLGTSDTTKVMPSAMIR